MAKCAICEKGAHVKSVRVKTEGGSKKMYVCTSCLKSGRVERA